jgi:hypothetical protein
MVRTFGSRHSVSKRFRPPLLGRPATLRLVFSRPPSTAATTRRPANGPLGAATTSRIASFLARSASSHTKYVSRSAAFTCCTTSCVTSVATCRVSRASSRSASQNASGSRARRMRSTTSASSRRNATIASSNIGSRSRIPQPDHDAHTGTTPSTRTIGKPSLSQSPPTSPGSEGSRPIDCRRCRHRRHPPVPRATALNLRGRARSVVSPRARDPAVEQGWLARSAATTVRPERP